MIGTVFMSIFTPSVTEREWGNRRSRRRGWGRRFILAASPDPACIRWHHGLAGFAAEGPAELRHVLDDSVDAKLAGRMGIGLHLQAELLGTRVAAPILPKAYEELLHRRITVLLLGEVSFLSTRVGKECEVGQPKASVVGGVLS